MCSAGGVREIYAVDAIGVLHEFVESELAPALGYTKQQAHEIATVAERLVDQRSPELADGEATSRPRSGWLTTRLVDEQEWLEEHNPEAQEMLLVDYFQMRQDIDHMFAGDDFLPLIQAFSEELDDLVAAHSQVSESDAMALRREHELAIAELYRLVPEVEGLIPAQVRETRRELRRQGRFRLEDVRRELRNLQRATARAGVRVGPTEFEEVAVRNVGWAVQRSNRVSPYLRSIAADRLLLRVSPQLRPLLSKAGEHYPVLLEIDAARRDGALWPSF